MEFGPDEEYVFYCQTRNARFVCLDVGLQEDVFMLHKPIMLRVVLEGLCFRWNSSTLALNFSVKTSSLHIRVVWCVCKHTQSATLEAVPLWGGRTLSTSAHTCQHIHKLIHTVAQTFTPSSTQIACTHAHTHTHTHTHAHTHAHTHKYTCMHSLIFLNVDVHTDILTHYQDIQSSHMLAT